MCVCAYITVYVCLNIYINIFVSISISISTTCISHLFTYSSSGPQELRSWSLASGIQIDTCDDPERHAAEPDMFHLRQQYLQGGSWDILQLRWSQHMTLQHRMNYFCWRNLRRCRKVEEGHGQVRGQWPEVR